LEKDLGDDLISELIEMEVLLGNHQQRSGIMRQFGIQVQDFESLAERGLRNFLMKVLIRIIILPVLIGRPDIGKNHHQNRHLIFLGPLTIGRHP